MKIKSITDVITNSSTEVFTCYFKEDLDSVKKIINLVLKTAGSEKTCDDLFDVNLKYEFTEEEYKKVLSDNERESWMKCKLKDPASYPLEPTRGDIDRMVGEFMDSYYCEDGEMSVDGPMIDGIEIKAKNQAFQKEAEEIGKLITNIGESLNVGWC